jgi:hypothetical protein
VHIIEELICAALRGESPPWPEAGDEAFAAAFLERSAYHGVQALLDQWLQSPHGRERGWPTAITDACHDATIAQAMWEMRHHAFLNQILARLSNSGVRPILFKGTALAYDVYPSPFLRRRGDTDLMISPHARHQVCEALESHGFACGFGVRGEFVSNTAVYSRIEPATGSHDLDVHWRVSNSYILSRLFSYEDLLYEARPLTTLGPDALGAGPVHALLIACLHRAGHKQCPYFVDHIEHFGGDRLIWLYDVHLLLGVLTPSHYETFLELAERAGLEAVCLEGIEQAGACFHCAVPETVREALSRPGSAEAVSRYLNGSAMYQYYANFLAIEGARNKLRFVEQLLFPPKDYMWQMYTQVQCNWLPWLYLRRAMIESFKRLHRTIASRRANHKPGK